MEICSIKIMVDLFWRRFVPSSATFQYCTIIGTIIRPCNVSYWLEEKLERDSSWQDWYHRTEKLSCYGRAWESMENSHFWLISLEGRKEKLSSSERNKNIKGKIVFLINYFLFDLNRLEFTQARRARSWFNSAWVWIRWKIHVFNLKSIF